MHFSCEQLVRLEQCHGRDFPENFSFRVCRDHDIHTKLTTGIYQSQCLLWLIARSREH